jgi:hypothetical protein
MKIILFLLITINIMFASIGTVVSLNGKAIVQRDNKNIDLKINDKIKQNDIINTFDLTLLKIVLKDKTQITLGENSSLNISKFLYSEKNKSQNGVNLNFFKGTFKSVTGRIGKLNPKKFKLKTKNASIGIRGTTVVGDQNKIACTSGLISVTSAGVTQMVRAGQMTQVQANKPPSKPSKYNPKAFGSVGSDTKESQNKKDNARVVVPTVPQDTEQEQDSVVATDPDPDPQDLQDLVTPTDPDPDPQDLVTPTDPDPQDPQDPQDPTTPTNTQNTISETTLYKGFASGIKNRSGYITTSTNSNSDDVQIEFNDNKTQVKADISLDSGYSYESSFSNTNSVTDDYTFSMSNNGDHVTSDLGHNDYTTWGTWSGSKEIPILGNSRLDQGYFIAGQLTNNDDLPTSGIVRYQGEVLGRVYENGYKNLNGTSTIIADFGSNSLRGTLKINYADTNATFSNARLNNTTISTGVNSFSGSLKNGGRTGTINGAFFGPNAAEIGGNWTLEKHGKKAAGIFNGVKDE